LELARRLADVTRCPLFFVDAGEEGEKFASFVEVILSRWLQWFYTNAICLNPRLQPRRTPSDHAVGVAGFCPVKKHLFSVSRPFSLVYSTYALV
jgi:hypothetical protein